MFDPLHWYSQYQTLSIHFHFPLLAGMCPKIVVKIEQLPYLSVTLTVCNDVTWLSYDLHQYDFITAGTFYLQSESSKRFCLFQKFPFENI